VTTLLNPPKTKANTPYPINTQDTCTDKSLALQKLLYKIGRATITPNAEPPMQGHKTHEKTRDYFTPRKHNNSLATENAEIEIYE
jgi:hypothetical protein